HRLDDLRRAADRAGQCDRSGDRGADRHGGGYRPFRIAGRNGHAPRLEARARRRLPDRRGAAGAVATGPGHGAGLRIRIRNRNREETMESREERAAKLAEETRTTLAALPEPEADIVAYDQAGPDVRQDIEQRMAELDLRNTQTIIKFGSGAQQKLTA